MKLNIISRSILLLTLLAACGSPVAALPAPQINVQQATATVAPTASQEISITDGLGRTVFLAAPAARVISLAPSNTEILFALGAGPQVVGRDGASDYPAEATSIASVGDTFVGLNSEQIVALQPDLVLAAEITPIEYVTQLEQLGITVFWLANPIDLDGLYANLNTVGLLTGHQEEATALNEQLRARVAAVDTALQDIQDTPTVFYELDASDPAAPWTSGPSTFIDLLITRAGGQNAASILNKQFAQMSIENLLQQNPDFILLGDAAYGVTIESVGQRAGWSQLAAVQNGQVVPFDDNLVSRPGPRLVDALEQLARLLHPEQFN